MGQSQFRCRGRVDQAGLVAMCSPGRDAKRPAGLVRDDGGRNGHGALRLSGLVPILAKTGQSSSGRRVERDVGVAGRLAIERVD
jgi:hypothetical protein